MSLCVLAAGVLTALAGDAFTLAWSHSVEKTRWEEDWRVTPSGLQLVEARVKGSGAGMEPPEGSILENGWWVYAPDLPAQKKLVLAASGATGEGWSLCVEGSRCLTLGAAESEPVALQACSGAH